MNVIKPMQQDPPADRTVFYKWSQVVDYLEDRFGKVTTAAWAEDAIVTEFSEESLKIEAGSDFKCEVLKLRCLNHIQNALKELFNSDAAVEIYSSES
jgi:chromosomal replication initiation ATPase DnaA